MDKLQKTMVGLPNTCARCGKELVDEAYALNDDQARAGQVFCARHAGVEDEKPDPKSAAKTADSKGVVKPATT